MMEKTIKKVLAAVCLVMFFISLNASASLVDDIVKPMTTTICKIYCIMYNISGALGALIITLSGFKWVGSAEDPGARKAAKDTIMHVLIGMLIIVIAKDIVGLVTGASACPDAC